jgi:hypothetical protein
MITAIGQKLACSTRSQTTSKFTVLVTPPPEAVIVSVYRFARCLATGAASVLAFLCRAHAQSGFAEGLGERNAITSQEFGQAR